jgi:threonine/homoserine efflux transporter RhtA
VNPFFVPMILPNTASGYLSIEHGYMGPNYTAVSACASANHAMGEAFHAIQRGDADVIFAGGTEAAVVEVVVAGFANMKALSGRNDDPQVAAAGMMVAGSLAMLPLGLPQAPAELAAAPAGPLWALITLTLVQTVIATVVFLRLVVIAGPSFVSFINYLIPVWAVLMGVTFLGERPGLGALVALVLILSGIGMSEIGRRRAAAKEASGVSEP